MSLVQGGATPTVVDAQLTPRQEAILMAVVAEYVHTGIPVGSQHVLEVTGLELSPASVRAQMATLEREGFLAQPHVSSGRVPLERGYRYFVDRLMRIDVDLLNRLRREVVRRLRAARGELDDLLELTLDLAVEHSQYTAVIALWSSEAEVVRAVHLVPLEPPSILAIVVGSRGALERAAFEVDPVPPDPTVVAAANFLTSSLRGRRMADRPEVHPSGSPDIDAVAFPAVAAISESRERERPELRVREVAKTASAFDELSKVTRVLETIEQRLSLVEVLRRLVEANELVAIGGESGVDALADCSLVVAPCEVDGAVVGSIGLLGPTRMDYGGATVVVEALREGVAEAVG